MRPSGAGKSSEAEFGFLNDFRKWPDYNGRNKREKMAEEAGDLEQELQRELGVEPEEKKEKRTRNIR